MQKQITDYVLYRWRYILSYVSIGIIVGGFLLLAALYVPGGLSRGEMASAVASSSLSIREFDPAMVIDFPYAVLQRMSFFIFDVTTLSIKLPSLLLGILTAIGLIMLLRSWFHENVAIITALISLTASQFIFSSQDGTPAILYIFLPVWMLLSAMMVSRQIGKRSLWEFILMATLALSLYTPLSAYIILALVSATLLHPHLRFIVGRVSKQKLVIATLTSLILLAPLITALVLRPSLGLVLLGVPSTMPDLQANALELARQYLSFLSPGAGEQLRPIYTLTTLSFVLLGLTRLFTTKYTARSYIITAWVILLVPVLLLNPLKTTITFLPVMLLVGMGGEVLLSRWYRLFPRNPYARVAGLIPITILIAGMTFSGMERYLYGYHYNPVVAGNFSTDLHLLNEQLKTRHTAPLSLVVSQPEVQFYQTVASYKNGVTVVQPGQPVPSGLITVATRAAFHERGLKEPTTIITNGRSSDSDRLYLYKTMP